MNIQAAFYFILAVTTTLKFYYFMSLKEL